MKFHLLTAYTDDGYREVGDLCAEVNEKYAAYWNYASFTAVVKSKEEMMQVVGSRGHPTWYKVHLFREWLRDEARKVSVSDDRIEQDQEYEYLVWLDADAVVVDFQKSLEKIVQNADHKDLIIAEDMHSGNLVNCGVILIKNSDWSRNLWDRVWKLQRTVQSNRRKREVVLVEEEEPAQVPVSENTTKENDVEQNKEYYNKPFYEQTALQKVLKSLGQFATFFTGDNMEDVLLKTSSTATRRILGEEMHEGVEVVDSATVHLGDEVEQQPVIISSTSTQKRRQKWDGWHSFHQPGNILKDVSVPEDDAYNFSGRTNSTGTCTTTDHLVDQQHLNLKHFANVCIYPIHKLNSNITDDALRLLQENKQPRGTSFRMNGNKRNYHRRTEFIFHAAGANKKKPLIEGMLKARRTLDDVLLHGENFSTVNHEQALMNAVA
ncbi:unnamed protein product [Amoebophrya sp. A120]|nr:unnamed protein product [Amoebophrya sp. A120]|eukprot:GSA120T00010881001.1